MKLNDMHPHTHVPVRDEPVKPGHVKIVRLAKEGQLGRGDLVETTEHGVCEVVLVNEVDAITVKTPAGERFLLSGIGGWRERGRLVEGPATSGDGVEHVPVERPRMRA
jgi:hypothetical protein